MMPLDLEEETIIQLLELALFDGISSIASFFFVNF